MAPAFAQAARTLEPQVRWPSSIPRRPQLAAPYNIRSIPTMVLFQGGREVARISGAWARRTSSAGCARALIWFKNGLSAVPASGRATGARAAPGQVEHQRRPRQVRGPGVGVHKDLDHQRHAQQRQGRQAREKPSTSSTGNRCSATVAMAPPIPGIRAACIPRGTAGKGVGDRENALHPWCGPTSRKCPPAPGARPARSGRAACTAQPLARLFHSPARPGGMQAGPTWVSGGAWGAVQQGLGARRRRCAAARRARGRSAAGSAAGPGRRRLQRWRPAAQASSSRSPRAAGAPIAQRRAGASAARLALPGQDGRPTAALALALPQA